METIEPFRDWLGREATPLDPIFSPRTVAVIGAKDTPGSVGRTLVANLMGKDLTVYPINPKRESVLGLKCFPTIGQVKEAIDLAVIVTPAATVPKVIRECAAAGVKGAIVLSAGFKEMGQEGLELELDLIEAARSGGIRLIGPNCLGVAIPSAGLNATFAKDMPLAGDVAFISQSGAMCTAVLDWSLEEGVGFSAFVSIGSMADVNWGDLIRYFGNDDKTRSILLYMETVGDARAFISAAREVALAKPIIVLKGGKTEESARACASHTGSLAGSDKVFDAALKRCGVMRVDTIGELFGLASTLAFQERPKGPRLAIVTNAGGPSVLATDALVLNGGAVAPLHESAFGALNALLPKAWSRANPVDILGDAPPSRYVEAVDILAKDPQNDGILVILSPQDMTDPLGTAQDLCTFRHIDKPLLTAWMGGKGVVAGREALAKGQIPCFAYPDEAAKTFAQMWQAQDNIRRLYETPTWSPDVHKESLALTDALIERVLNEGRTLLDERESKELLSYWKIPVVTTRAAKTPEEAVAMAEEIGYPACVKLLSHTITHKSDVGGVKLNLQDPEEVYDAFMMIQNLVPSEDFLGVTVQNMVKIKGYELILGSSYDPQFGPVLLFGSGGSLVEIYRDTALALPPLNTTLADMMLKETKIYQALQGYRGEGGVDLDLLVETMVNFSNMIMAHPRIKECDINPLIASSSGLIALDARIVLFSKGETLPKAAIRPYPMEYCWHEKLDDGLDIAIRPIRPEDEPKVVRYHEWLSPQTVHQRYFHTMDLQERITHERLIEICCNDYDREWALIAESEGEIIGIARLTKGSDPKKCELKMMILDQYQKRGVGRALLAKLLEVAKKEGISEIWATALESNQAFQRLCLPHFQKVDKKGVLVRYRADLV